MAKESVDFVKNALSIRENQYDDYISARIMKCEVPIYKKIKKNNLSLFREKSKVSPSKGKMKAVSLKEERNLYASLFVASQLRDCNMDEFFKHEHHNYPPSISEYGTLRKTSKSDFLDCLQDYSSSTLTPPEFTAKVVDGTAAVQSLKRRIPKTFDQYASTEFYNSVLRCLNEECVQRVDVVFDRYFPLSLKGDTRKGRGSGLRVSVRENTPMVQDWAKFLKDSSNKAELFHLIAKKITRIRTDHKMVLATQRKKRDFLVNN